MTPEVISVSEFIAVLNETLGFAFPAVTIEGEVSSFKVNQGKWVFFDLKDSEATLNCFMALYQLKVPLEDGMRVRITGVPRFTKWGKFSFTVRRVELAGEGELRRAFEILKARLSAEGLFRPERKRPLPRYPRRLGVVTSAQSAAYGDFIKILDARWGGLTILVADVQVQGALAPDQLVAAINYFNQLAEPVDALVIIRGGGSLEDLQAFSTEAVARAVAASRTPTIVGVGHEVDVSLADYAADVRAATPTNAAQLVVPERREILAATDHYRHRLLSRAEQLQHDLARQLDHSINRLEGFVRLPREAVTRHQQVINWGMRSLVSDTTSKLALTQRLLRGFDPTATLARGYAIVRHGKAIVRSSKQVNAGDTIVIQLHRDSISSEVL